MKSERSNELSSDAGAKEEIFRSVSLINTFASKGQQSYHDDDDGGGGSEDDDENQNDDSNIVI